MQKRKKQKASLNFSKNLNEIRNMVLTITKNPNITIKYDKNAETSYYNPENDEVVLSLNSYPEWAIKQPRLAKKILDADAFHESGHILLTKPIWHYLNAYGTKIKAKKGNLTLLKEIINVLEDKRVNYFIETRYRFDFGKRLKMADILLKDAIETAVSDEKLQKARAHGEAPIMLGIMVNEGLYGADCSKYWQLLSDSAKKDLKTILEIMENYKYNRVRLNIIRDIDKIYNLLMKYAKNCYIENQLLVLIPIRLKGKLKTAQISNELKQKLKALIKAEEEKEAQKEAENLVKDLLKGLGAGKGTGKEIPAPEPDFANYSRILDRNKEEINRLLNKLKQRLKPVIKKADFQKRGKIMPNLIVKAYANSFIREVRNIYINVKSKLEKEKVAIGFLIDFSGSVNRKTAEDITVILNEVFGRFVDDYSYAVAVFGANSQKIKTFFETYENTKARCGNITVSAAGTEISVLLESFLKMFNAITDDRRKILVIASDFCFGDEARANELIKLFPLSNVELIFIGFSNCYKIRDFASDVKNTHKTRIKTIKELPERFLEVYINAVS